MHPGTRRVVDVRRRTDQARARPPRPDHERLAPGSLAITKNSVHVGTATDPVRLGLVRAHGRKQMPATDFWARGLRFNAAGPVGLC